MRNATSRKLQGFPAGSAKKNHALPPRDKAALLAQRETWLQQIDPSSLFHRLFDLIPGVYFFAKNLRGELMFLSRNTRDQSHLADETAVIGLTDFDLNPRHMAMSFTQDDARIIATGQPMLNHVEMWVDQLGVPDWFVVNKMPIRSRTGAIIGVMGFSQSYKGRAKFLEPDRGLSKAVSHIRDNYHQDTSIRELSKLAGLSARQLERKFHAAFGLGPQQFLIKTRLRAGCQALLETKQTISEIAYACGFSDQSAFARHFRKHLGMTPKAFRHQKEKA